MGIKNEEVMKLIKDKFKSLEGHLNVLETEIKKEDDKFDKVSIALSIGKISKIYEDLAFYLGVFDEVPKYEGR